MSLGFLVEAVGEVGGDWCTNEYTDPQGAVGQVNYMSEHYVALAGGWVAGVFGDGNPILSGLHIRVHEYGSVYGGGDDPYHVWLMTDLSCVESDDPEACTEYLGEGYGRTDFPVP